MAFQNLLVLLHIAAVIIWVGGMFFAHFCLRPAAAAQLAPPQRLPLLLAVLGRFFKYVAAAIAVLWITGITRFIQVGAAAPASWHAMAGLAALMTGIFGMIVLRFYPRLARAVESQDWPRGGAAMNVIRQLVLVNLALGTLTVIVALAW